VNLIHIEGNVVSTCGINQLRFYNFNDFEIGQLRLVAVICKLLHSVYLFTYLLILLPGGSLWVAFSPFKSPFRVASPDHIQTDMFTTIVRSPVLSVEYTLCKHYTSINYDRGTWRPVMPWILSKQYLSISTEDSVSTELISRLTRTSMPKCKVLIIAEILPKIFRGYFFYRTTVKLPV